MAARTGQHYIQSLGRMSPSVFLNGRRVERIPNSGRVPERAVDPQREGSAKQVRAVT